MVTARAFLLLSLLLLPVRSVPAAACDPAGADKQAVADARADVAAHCPCAGATQHGAYVKCVKGIIVTRVGNHQLPASCTGVIMSCAARSTCGRPGFVACCRTPANGAPKCSIKHDAASCRAPRGGTACASPEKSCCDACSTGGGCPCTGPNCGPPPVCGDFVLEGDETCDGDGDILGAPNRCNDGGIPNKHRCARPGEVGACHRCCGVGVGQTTGLICLGDADCCGHCVDFGPPANRRCVD